MNNPRASVIIPTYNGKDKLTNVLLSLEKQSVLDVEILVIIDGSTDGTLQHIQSRQWKLNSLRLIEQKNKGRAGARNAGAKEASSNLLIFFDDDMIVESDCIEKHIQTASGNVNTIFMGQVIEPSAATDPEIKHYKDYLNRSWEKTLDPFRNSIIPANLNILSAQNLCMSLEVFTALNGFDERLKDIEDYDFALRAKEKNIGVFYLADARAIHADFFNFKKYATRSKDYLANRIIASKLKPELYSNDPILTHQTSFFQKLVYAVFKYPFWLWLLDHFNVFRCIYPKALRYKIYGIIITAYVHSFK